MPRQPRVVIAGIPYHLTQRGNHRQDVFFTPEDRDVYLRWLQEYRVRFDLSLWAYCLMTTHVHFVGTPNQEPALARTLQAVQGRYTQRINAAHGWSGHLWQGRFFSCALDESHFWRAIRYVEGNPVRAGLVARAEEYPWSSAATHCGLTLDPLLEPLPDGCLPPESWSAWLAQEDADDTLLLRRCTRTGIPCGSPELLEQLSTHCGRPLIDRPRGRPMKVRAEREKE